MTVTVEYIMVICVAMIQLRMILAASRTMTTIPCLQLCRVQRDRPFLLLLYEIFTSYNISRHGSEFPCVFKAIPILSVTIENYNPR